MAELTKEQVIEYLSGLTVTQLVELVKDLEQRWGVQAVTAVPMAVPAAGGVAPAAVEEEKVITYSVVIKDAGQQKVQLIKVLREIFPELGLKEAKALVDAAPKTIKEGLTREEAEDLKKKLEQAGATVEITSK
ncbi:MAG: 50S ribosomal protein L7/L12 [Acidobacteria bacterium]|nr:50S ribosomal protein L7/L12 [Acidobacteriota bacterium]